MNAVFLTFWPSAIRRMLSCNSNEALCESCVFDVCQILGFLKFGIVIRRKPLVKSAFLLKFRPAVIRRKPQVKTDVLKFWRL